MTGKKIDVCRWQVKKIDDTTWQVEITDDSRWQVKKNNDIRWQIKATDDSRWSDLAVAIQTWWEVLHAGKGWVGQDQIEEGDCNLIERTQEYVLCWVTLMSNLNIYSIRWHIHKWDQHFSNKKSLQLFRQYNFEKCTYCDSLHWRDLIVLRTDR